MNVGIKAVGRSGTKAWTQRHGHKRGVSRRSYARCEKAIETAVRRAGKAACKAAD